MIFAHSRFVGEVRPLFLLLIVLIGMAPLAMTAPCRAQEAKPAAVTPEQRAAALAGAQGAIRRMAQAKSLPEVADVLTNKSAVSVGVLFVAMADMAVSFAQMPGAKSASGVSPAKLKRDYDALLARWGTREDDKNRATGKNGAEGPSIVAKKGVGVSADGLPLPVARNGRRFMVDVANFMDKLDPKSGASFKNAGDFSVSDFTYTVLSPTRVGLTMKPKAGAKTEAPAEAIFEDGKWRLNIGDMNKKPPHR